VQTTSQLRLRKGFVLVEVLASIVIASIVGISVAELVSLFLKQLDQVTDLVTARQRGEMILSRLELPVLRAGLFMPNTPDVFISTFKVGSMDLVKGALQKVVVGWNKPVFLCEAVDGKETKYFKKMGIVYSLDSSIGILTERDVEAGQEVSLKLSSPCPGDQLRAATTLIGTDCWVTFSGCETPYLIKAINNVNKSLTIMASRRDLIPLFSELQYVRALCAYIDFPGGASPSFCLQDVTRGSAQPIADSISQVLFSFDEYSKILSVYLLIRGNHRFSRQITQGDVSGWPINDTITDEDRHYRLIAMAASWRVRNWLEERQ